MQAEKAEKASKHRQLFELYRQSQQAQLECGSLKPYREHTLSVETAEVFLASATKSLKARPEGHAK